MAKKKATPEEKTFRIVYFRDQLKTFLTGERVRTTMAKAKKQAEAFLKGSSFANSYKIIEEKTYEKASRKKVTSKASEDTQIGKGEEPQ
jgi:hypothetical protein